MSIALIIGLIVAWMVISAVVVVCASMMSSQISKAEERGERLDRLPQAMPTYAMLESQRIPTQPRTEILH